MPYPWKQYKCRLKVSSAGNKRFRTVQVYWSIFGGGCWLVVESADCLVISAAILEVIVNWGVAMVADERWYDFSCLVIGSRSVCNVTTSPCWVPRELLLWTAGQERRQISSRTARMSSELKKRWAEWKKMLSHLEGAGMGWEWRRKKLEVLVLSFNVSLLYEVLLPRRNVRRRIVAQPAADCRWGYDTNYLLFIQMCQFSCKA